MKKTMRYESMPTSRYTRVSDRKPNMRTNIDVVTQQGAERENIETRILSKRIVKNESLRRLEGQIVLAEVESCLLAAGPQVRCGQCQLRLPTRAVLARMSRSFYI